MKLTVYFYDAKGMSLQSPEILTGDNPLGLYARANEMRDVLIVTRGVPVFLQCVEGE